MNTAQLKVLVVAEALVASLTSDAARGKSFELVAETGPAQKELEPLLLALAADHPGALDAVRDPADMPLCDEPATVREDLAQIARH